MNELLYIHRDRVEPLDKAKFCHPDVTAKGENRAKVALNKLDTLWINTGTLCNITCQNCYIESSPSNDRLVYFSLDDAVALYDEIATLELPTREIAFTGGEPFMNPDVLAMIETALARGFEVLVLTNAMKPMQRTKIRQGLLKIQAAYGDKLSLRISLDHYGCDLHDAERGTGSWDAAISGLNWLSQNGFNIAIAGRSCWGESEATARAGYGQLIANHDWQIDSNNKQDLVLFPEMDEQADVPEITTSCWGILDKSPNDVMCASSRMAIKRKGSRNITVVACTLLAYDPAFEMGATLAESFRADDGNFVKGAVKLNHPHCAKFCVLGGASCAVDY